MQVDDTTVAEFQALYERELRKPIAVDEARDMVHRVLTLYDVLVRPLPQARPSSIEPVSSDTE
jgi:hypothetical protein